MISMHRSFILEIFPNQSKHLFYDSSRVLTRPYQLYYMQLPWICCPYHYPPLPSSISLLPHLLSISILFTRFPFNQIHLTTSVLNNILQTHLFSFQTLTTHSHSDSSQKKRVQSTLSAQKIQLFKLSSLHTRSSSLHSSPRLSPSSNRFAPRIHPVLQ